MTEIDADSNILENVEKMNETAGKGPLSALLTPSFDILGKELGKWTESVFEKRKKNANHHASEVKLKNPTLVLEATPAKQEDIIAWNQEASKYDSTDAEAKIWQGVLDEIMSTKGSQSYLISVAKQLDKDDIESLIFIKENPWYPFPELSNSIKKMQKIGIINEEKYVNPRILFLFSTTAVTISVFIPLAISKLNIFVNNIDSIQKNMIADFYNSYFGLLFFSMILLFFSYFYFFYFEFFVKRERRGRIYLLDIFSRVTFYRRRFILGNTAETLVEKVQKYSRP